MPVVKIPANSFKVEVEDPATPGTYLEIKGLNSMEISFSSERADTTTWDDNGWASHILTQRSLEITLEGLRLEDPDTGARDPGQKIVEDLGLRIGVAAVGSFKITTPGGETIEFQATVDVTPFGGGQNDGASWSATLAVTGQPMLTRTGS